MGHGHTSGKVALVYCYISQLSKLVSMHDDIDDRRYITSEKLIQVNIWEYTVCVWAMLRLSEWMHVG